MDVVERVARALAECAGYDPDETWEEFDRNAAATASLCDGVSDDEIFPKFIRWREYEAPARAILPIIAAREGAARAEGRREGIEEAYQAVLKTERCGQALRAIRALAEKQP